MKKIFRFLIFLFSYINSNGQSNQILVSLPLGKNGKGVTNFGVSHTSGITHPGETAYSDTGIANHYFKLLSKEVNPENVVLVVEYPETPYTKDIVTTDTILSAWITPEIRKLGFTKWIAADPRSQNDSYAYHTYRPYLAYIANKYFSIQQIKDSIDFWGFPEISFTQKDSIPKNVEDSCLRNILPVAGNVMFEINIKKICFSLRLAGYTPVVVAGSAHVLALREPCVIQVENLGMKSFDWLYEQLNIIKANRFLMKYFMKKNNFIFTPK